MSDETKRPLESVPAPESLADAAMKRAVAKADPDLAAMLQPLMKMTGTMDLESIQRVKTARARRILFRQIGDTLDHLNKLLDEVSATVVWLRLRNR